MLPPRKAEPGEQYSRMYVQTTASTRLRLMEESVSRGVTQWGLAGLVLAMWCDAGCPTLIVSADAGGDLGVSE